MARIIRGHRQKCRLLRLGVLIPGLTQISGFRVKPEMTGCVNRKFSVIPAPEPGPMSNNGNIFTNETLWRDALSDIESGAAAPV